MKLVMGSVRSVIRHRFEKVTQDSLEPQCDGIHSSQLVQAYNQIPQVLFVRGFEGIADQLVELFANYTASQGSPGPFPLDLKFSDEMEVAELENPTVLFGDSFHSIQIVDDKRANSKPDFGRKTLERLLPTESAFFAGQKQGIEKDSRLPRARFHRHQVEYPRPSAEVKAQTIDQEGQRTAGKFLATGTSHKALESLSEPVAEVGQRYLRPPMGQVLKRKPLEKDLLEDLGRHPETRTTAFAGANRPGSFAVTTLAASTTKPENFGLTTRGFRMLSVHTRELSRRSSNAQTEYWDISVNLSTDFLYPTPNCDRIRSNSP